MGCTVAAASKTDRIIVLTRRWISDHLTTTKTGIFMSYEKGDDLLELRSSQMTIPLGRQAQFQMSKPSYLDVAVQTLSQTLVYSCD